MPNLSRRPAQGIHTAVRRTQTYQISIFGHFAQHTYQPCNKTHKVYMFRLPLEGIIKQKIGVIHPSMALKPLPGLGLPQKLPPFVPVFRSSPPSSRP